MAAQPGPPPPAFQPPRTPRTPLRPAAIVGGLIGLAGAAALGLSTMQRWGYSSEVGTTEFDFWKIAEYSDTDHSGVVAFLLLAVVAWHGVYFAIPRKGWRAAWPFPGLLLAIITLVLMLATAEDSFAYDGREQNGVPIALLGILLLIVGAVVSLIGNVRRPRAPANAVLMPYGPPPVRDVPTQLRELGELRDRGILTQQEFEAQKRGLIGEPPPNAGPGPGSPPA